MVYKQTISWLYKVVIFLLCQKINIQYTLLQYYECNVNKDTSKLSEIVEVRVKICFLTLTFMISAGIKTIFVAGYYITSWGVLP